VEVSRLGSDDDDDYAMMLLLLLLLLILRLIMMTIMIMTRCTGTVWGIADRESRGRAPVGHLLEFDSLFFFNSGLNFPHFVIAKMPLNVRIEIRTL